MNVGGTFARTGVPQTVSSTSYNVNNQLTNWKGRGLTYDANGNLTNDGTNTYTWNARNQLASISGGVAASFQYDAFGRRVSKTIGGTTQYLYDGVNPVQEISGSSASANLLTGGLDEYFQRTDSAGARNFLTDALGSTLALSDSTGTTQTSYTFEPFGNTTTSGAATTNSFAFTGRELDATGLYFYRARYYNPQLQRFISEDPIEFGGGDANLYSIAGDEPTDFLDPTGLTRTKYKCDVFGNCYRDHPPGSQWGLHPGTPIAGRKCGSPALHGSFGIAYGGNADAGNGLLGFSAAGSGGIGIYGNSNTGGSLGAYASGGVAAYAGSAVGGAPTQQVHPVVAGAYAGAGPSVWISNAGSPQQQTGPFTTATLSVGAGPVRGSLQLSFGGGIWQFSVGLPIPFISPATPSASFSMITTNTVATSGCK